MNRYIDVDAYTDHVCKELCGITRKECPRPADKPCLYILMVENFPEAKDVKKVVTCEKCRYIGETGAICSNAFGMTNPCPEGFCSCGKEKDHINAVIAKAIRQKSFAAGLGFLNITAVSDKEIETIRQAAFTAGLEASWQTAQEIVKMFDDCGADVIQAIFGTSCLGVFRGNNIHQAIHRLREYKSHTS